MKKYVKDVLFFLFSVLLLLITAFVFLISAVENKSNLELEKSGLKPIISKFEKENEISISYIFFSTPFSCHFTINEALTDTEFTKLSFDIFHQIYCEIGEFDNYNFLGKSQRFNSISINNHNNTKKVIFEYSNSEIEIYTEKESDFYALNIPDVSVNYYNISFN